MSTLMQLDTVNLFVGDADPDKSEYLALKGFKIPSLEENTKEHKPGGGVVGFKIGMRSINALSFSFSLEGINPGPMNKFMTTRRENYTFRGNMTNVRTQEDIPVLGVVHGRMTKIETSEFKKDDGVGMDYEINEVVRYRLVIGREEKYFFDAFGGPGAIRIDGKSLFRNVARNIGLGV